MDTRRFDLDQRGTVDRTKSPAFALSIGLWVLLAYAPLAHWWPPEQMVPHWVPLSVLGAGILAAVVAAGFSFGAAWHRRLPRSGAVAL